MTSAGSQGSAGPSAGVAMLGLPYDASGSYLRGPAKAPEAIRRALASDASNSWTESFLDVQAGGRLDDLGDATLSDTTMRRDVEAAVHRVLETGRRPLFLGGDHSVSYPVLRALRPSFPSLTIVQLDAHPDLYDVYEGDRYSHACPFARIMEERLADRLVQVGIRTLNAHQRDQASRFGVEMHQASAWRGVFDARFDGPVYLSFDLDALDPAFAPGVSHREPGGLSTREALEVVHHLSGRLIGADLVELNPDTDIAGVSATVCAKLVKEIVGALEG